MTVRFATASEIPAIRRLQGDAIERLADEIRHEGIDPPASAP